MTIDQEYQEFMSSLVESNMKVSIFRYSEIYGDEFLPHWSEEVVAEGHKDFCDSVVQGCIKQFGGTFEKVLGKNGFYGWKKGKVVIAAIPK